MLSVLHNPVATHATTIPSPVPTLTNSGGALFACERCQAAAVQIKELVTPGDIKALFRAADEVLASHGWKTLITDASEVGGATFDTVWTLETEIEAFVSGHSGAEWRHVASLSPALQLSVRRMLRSAQSKGARCGVYESLEEAAAVGVANPQQAAAQPFRNMHGHLVEAAGHLTVELGIAATDADLAVLMDAAVERSQHVGQPCLILHLPVGQRNLSSGFLLQQAARVHAFGRGGVVLIADEAGLMSPEMIPECPKGILHYAPSLVTALSHLLMFRLDRYRLPLRAA